MSLSTHTLAERFRDMPRALQWLAMAIAFVVLFNVWDLTIARTIQDLDKSADRIESHVSEIQLSSTLATRWKNEQMALQAIGELDVPGTNTATRDDLVRAVEDIKAEYNIRDIAFELGKSKRLPNRQQFQKLATQLKRLHGDRGGKLEYYSGKIEFTAKPDKAIAIIADLEAQPAIESISIVRLRVEDSDVDVDLTIEAWIYVPDRGV